MLPEDVALPERRNVSVVGDPIMSLFQRDNGYTKRCVWSDRHPVVTCLREHLHTTLLTDLHLPLCILTTQYIGSLHRKSTVLSSHVRWYHVCQAKVCIWNISTRRSCIHFFRKRSTPHLLQQQDRNVPCSSPVHAHKASMTESQRDNIGSRAQTELPSLERPGQW